MINILREGKHVSSGPDSRDASRRRAGEVVTVAGARDKRAVRAEAKPYLLGTRSGATGPAAVDQDRHPIIGARSTEQHAGAHVKSLRRDHGAHLHRAVRLQHNSSRLAKLAFVTRPVQCDRSDHGGKERIPSRSWRWWRHEVGLEGARRSKGSEVG